MNHPPPIGKNIQNKRKEKRMSLDVLSKRSGVSKSMLSQIEQEKTNPTVVTAWKIAKALSMTVNELMENKEGGIIDITHYHDTPISATPDGLASLRVVSPLDNTSNIEIYYVNLQPGGVNDSGGHSAGAEEFLHVIKGSVKLTVGEHEASLKKGDTAHYNADTRHVMSNEIDGHSEAILVVNLPNK